MMALAVFSESILKMKKERSYRKQIARQLRTQYVEGSP